MSKRDDVLSAAEQLFYQEGFHRTGVAKIAQCANTTQRTLYKHFPSKEALILAIMKEREARYWACLKEVEQQAEYSFKALVPFFALLHWNKQQHHGGCFYLHALAEYQGKNDDIVDYVRGYKRRLSEGFDTRLQQDGVSRPHLSTLLMLIYEGITASSALELPSHTWDQTIDHVLQLLNDAG